MSGYNESNVAADIERIEAYMEANYAHARSEGWINGYSFKARHNGGGAFTMVAKYRTVRGTIRETYSVTVDADGTMVWSDPVR